ncbi:hypothetical protein A1O3_05834 [Capronia epimyces CBS 606.96]|uniref:L-serine ammonia-lyase n=1 Tax=Capronia epimyces CBS 606.96 TaxID=1182542 RepID=W9YS97_9EURO|nr:uncharacterized protein A1O3_05834 [Capronia epimyces CBS 606.96]EXJ85159.1 hypothetical protein A1O3_05834 [Capronia epimyces CBS 606.96]
MARKHTHIDANLWIQTPLIESRALSEAAGCTVYLKLDNLQPSGSFKSRGIGNYIRRRVQEAEAEAEAEDEGNNDQRKDQRKRKRIHFYAASGGNAGIACVHAARQLGYGATVVVPTTAKAAMVAKIQAMGASAVIQHGANIMEADRFLREEVLASKDADEHGIYVPPFDHLDVWDGNATVMQEIASQLDDRPPDVVLCSVGGGGLLNGIMQELDRRDWGNRVHVVAMETDGADSLNRSIRAGQLVTLDRITSQALSLGVSRVSAKTFQLAQRPNVKSLVLDDRAAKRGCCLLAMHERLMVELTVGVNVAACYGGLLQSVLGASCTVTPETKVVIVVCGGNDVSIELLHSWWLACEDELALALAPAPVRSEGPVCC